MVDPIVAIPFVAYPLMLLVASVHDPDPGAVWVPDTVAVATVVRLDPIVLIEQSMFVGVIAAGIFNFATYTVFEMVVGPLFA